jgi:2'-5' RNA ligase
VFLGPTDPSHVARLAEATQRVASAHQPFNVATGDAGGRTHTRRGGVAWLRISDGGHRVAELALNMDEALATHTYDANNGPRPHLTVARGVTDDALAALRERARNLEIGWTVDRVVLFRSYTDPGGSLYEELTSGTLGARLRDQSNTRL